MHWQIPPITIGDPVGAAAAEPVDCWLVDWLADVAPDVVGLLDDDLLLDEQATRQAPRPVPKYPLQLTQVIHISPECWWRTPSGDVSGNRHHAY